MNNFISPEDLEDFEQEKRIKEWLSSQSHEDRGIVLPYTSSKGSARNSRVRAAFSLDQKVCNDSETTFANFVAGSDGRDLWNGRSVERDAKRLLMDYLLHLQLGEELSQWTLKMLLKLADQNSLRLNKFLMDSE